MIALQVIIFSCTTEHSKDSSMEHDLGKAIEERIKQFESQNRLEFFDKTFIKKDAGKIFTFEIKGMDDLTIKKGVVGEYAESTNIHFESDSVRLPFIETQLADILEHGYREAKYDDQTILFIQIKPHNSQNSKDLSKQLDQFEEVSRLFDEPIYEKNLGSYAASDLGAGYNILYSVWDEKKGFDAILQVIENHQLEDRSIVAKRIYKSEEDWDYEVIYPNPFNGEFDPL
ncbi:hypothetical protein [Chondrinema litorale]|uniref:hypothetical protein n=1 Tax=Chondrinema litorale TaxID=2994555 RepID=UPI002543EEEA|nr:hypothetical protein [Chondrinema litorale]UZR99543.1 hypothetical protein OQ292_36740 [Chondrinema litorale]